MATIKGGAKLESALRAIAEKVSKSATLNVGFLTGSTYPDGTSVPMVAAIQEFGAPGAGIPPRPFFRSMVASKSPEWPDRIAGALKANGYDASKALSQVGESIRGDLQESIIDTMEPALSPVTVMLRGMKSNNPNLIVTGKTVGEAAARVAAGKTNYGASTKPLVESGDMLNAVAFEVKE